MVILYVCLSNHIVAQQFNFHHKKQVLLYYKKNYKVFKPVLNIIIIKLKKKL